MARVKLKCIMGYPELKCSYLEKGLFYVFYDSSGGPFRIILLEIFHKKDILKNSVKFTESNCNEALVLVKLQVWATLLKKTPLKVCSLKLYEILQKKHTIEHLWTAVSVLF